MIGYISYCEDYKTWGMRERKILGLRMLQVDLPAKRKVFGKLSAARAAKAMAKLGVRQAIFPVDLPWADRFFHRGILPVDILPLYRRMAPQIVKKCLIDQGISPGGSTVAVVGENLTGELGKILTELALQVRYLTLSVSYGGEEFCHGLRREYGVSVLQRPIKAQLAAAEALLLFAPREGLEEENPVVLRLYDGARVVQSNGVTFGLPPQLEGELEENCCREQVLAALLAAGILQNYQIPVLEVDKAGKSYYNASTVTNIE